MRMVDLIQKKRDGGLLSEQEIRFFIEGYTRGELPDYQASALMMAIYFQGLGRQETALLTQAMAESGEQLDLSGLGEATVDKHSTGGVGDKTTLVVAPIAAACGCTVAKISGRGLGHTGGTVDKLESIPGFQVELSPEEFQEHARQAGLCVVGQSGNLAPADKKLYALRDVTATVENQSLIAASIMSKKLAAGSRSIVLDVKTGSGAFMKTREEACGLARIMVEIGRAAGRRMRAVVTNMDRPLGHAIGNALEVQEAISVLKGEGPEDLLEVCQVLASHMVSLAKKVALPEARAQVETALEKGTALEKFCQMIRAQGGDVRAADDFRFFPQPRYAYTVKSRQGGNLVRIQADACGRAAMLLGAGRAKKEDSIDYAAGILLKIQPGQKIGKGESLATFYTNDSEKIPAAEELLLRSLQFSDSAVSPDPLILDVIGEDQ